MREINIDKIRNEFYKKAEEFSYKLEPVYKILDWKWAFGENSEMRVPNQKEILDTLNRIISEMTIHTPKECLEDRVLNERNGILTGGLRVGYRYAFTKSAFDGKDIVLYVELIIKFEFDGGKYYNLSEFIESK